MSRVIPWAEHTSMQPLCSTPVPRFLRGSPLGPPEQGFSERFRGLSALTCSHVPGLVNEGDYGICHPRRNYKRKTMLWTLGDMFHSGQGDQDARSPEGRCLVNRWQEIWARRRRMGRPFFVGFHFVFLGPSFSSKLCYLKCLSHLQTLSPAQVYEEFSRICT